jgi:hypothetical protein
MNRPSQPWRVPRVCGFRPAALPGAGDRRPYFSLLGAGILFVLGVGSSMMAFPQSSRAPQLQQRPKLDPEGSANQPLLLPGHTDLPEGAWGEYAFGASGEVIEMNLEGRGKHQQLSGYVSRLGVGATDKGTPLTYFFSYSSVAPDELSFATLKVHGRWWSFVGNIVRGTAAAPSQRGYYLLTGTVTEHVEAEKLEQRTVVSLPLLPKLRH